MEVVAALEVEIGREVEVEITPELAREAMEEEGALEEKIATEVEVAGEVRLLRMGKFPMEAGGAPEAEIAEEVVEEDGVAAGEV